MLLPPDRGHSSGEVQFILNEPVVQLLAVIDPTQAWLGRLVRAH